MTDKHSSIDFSIFQSDGIDDTDTKNDKECKKWLMSIFQSADLKENINV